MLNAALDGIAETTGLPGLYADDSWYVQMAAAALPTELDLVGAAARLFAEFRVEVPLLEWNGRKLIRVSVQGYNSLPDIERLLSALRILL